jgi:ATP-dependent Clp protease ATP-binding subunit ClpA
MVDKVVPFLPLSKPQLRTILDLKLQEKSAARRSASYLKHIHIDSRHRRLV